jgi:hypothetical protein
LKQGRRVWQGLQAFRSCGQRFRAGWLPNPEGTAGDDNLLPGLESFADLALAAALHSNLDVHHRKLALVLRNDDDASRTGADDRLGWNGQASCRDSGAKLTVTNIPGTRRLPGLGNSIRALRVRVVGLTSGSRVLTRPLITVPGSAAARASTAIPGRTSDA